jgi:hypothetical protein
LKSFYNTSLIWTSNAIEGFSYALIETALLLKDGITAGGNLLSRALAVTGLNDALKHMRDIAPKNNVGEGDVKSFHRMLKGSLFNDSVPGEYIGTRGIQEG